MNISDSCGTKLGRRIKTILTFALGCSILLPCISLLMANDDQIQKAERLFGSDRVIPIHVQVESENIQRLMTRPHEYVSGKVRVEDEVFAGAELRLKGSGSFRPITQNPSLCLKLRKSQTRGPPFGHKRLLLNNSVQDPALVRWKLASELFLKAGLPAARVNFARVDLNGRDLGLYLMVEPSDKIFLYHHFRSASGNLYEGSNHDVGDRLEIDSGDVAGNQADLKLLASACLEQNLSLRWQRIRGVLDVEEFVSFMALEVLITHHDGYSMDRNNFRIYHDPTTDRLVFIPHGMDMILRLPELTLEPPWRGLVAKAVMETDEGRRLYRQRVGEIARMVYGTEGLTNRINTLSNLLRENLVASRDDQRRKQLDASIAELQRIVQRRASFVLTQLKTVKNSLR